MNDNVTNYDMQRCSITLLLSSTFQRKAKHNGTFSSLIRKCRIGQIESSIIRIIKNIHIIKLYTLIFIVTFIIHWPVASHCI